MDIFSKDKIPAEFLKTFLYDTTVNMVMANAIDIESTKDLKFKSDISYYRLEQAVKFLEKTQLDKYSVIFLGTRSDISEIAKLAAFKSNQNYLCQKWIPGLLTNWIQKKSHFQYYKNLDMYFKKFYFNDISKLQGTLSTKYITFKNYFRMNAVWQGMLKINKRPQLLIILNTDEHEGALREAHRVGIPTIGLVNTNGDPRLITYPIPCNTNDISQIIFYSNIFSTILKKK